MWRELVCIWRGEEDPHVPNWFGLAILRVGAWWRSVKRVVRRG